jgi:hypothetical protein
MFFPQYPVHFDLDFQEDDITWTDEAKASHDKKTWFNKAIKLKVFNSYDVSLEALTSKIFPEIEQTSSKKFKSPYKAKQALKMVLINLWQANSKGVPVRYSRRRNNYVSVARYGKYIFRYDTLIPVVDCLKELGYIEQKPGRSWYEDKDKGNQTRMWASPKLIILFMKYLKTTPTFYKKPEELIILNKEVEVKSRKKSKKIKTKKVKVDYTDTKQTRQMREDLEKYRAFVKKHYIFVRITGEQLVNYEFLFDLYDKILNGTNSLDFVEQIGNSIENIQFKKYTDSKVINYYRNNFISKPITIFNSIDKSYPFTDMDSRGEAIDKDLQRFKDFEFIYNFEWYLAEKYREMAVARRNYDAILREEFELRSINVLRIHIGLNQEILYRTFNRNSFSKGGRAFGATYQRLPSLMRKGIHINNEKTVEIDYSAYHIRMLYHLNGIDYTEDPYIVCGGEKYRKAFKCASLVIINAKDEAEAKSAIRDKLIDSRIPFPDVKEPLNWMVSRFKEAHQPIANYICSDYGINLQNTDSHIMNSILMSLMDKKILGLSLYDSVIVAEQHEDVLREAMIGEYEKVMGFKPRL